MHYLVLLIRTQQQWELNDGMQRWPWLIHRTMHLRTQTPVNQVQELCESGNSSLLQLLPVHSLYS